MSVSRRVKLAGSALAMLAFGSNLALASPANGELLEGVRNGPTTVDKPVADGKPTAYITFDDGPNENTPLILDILDRHQAKATFFTTGVSALSAPQTVERLIEDNHGLGNHTWRHTGFNGNYQDAFDQLEPVNKVLAENHSIRLACYRPPYGKNFSAPGVVQAATELGLTNAGWTTNYGGYDNHMGLWSLDTSDYLRDYDLTYGQLDKTSEGSIVLLHDIHATTTKVFDDWMAANGERFSFKVLPSCESERDQQLVADRCAPYVLLGELTGYATIADASQPAICKNFDPEALANTESAVDNQDDAIVLAAFPDSNPALGPNVGLAPSAVTGNVRGVDGESGASLARTQEPRSPLSVSEVTRTQQPNGLPSSVDSGRRNVAKVSGHGTRFNRTPSVLAYSETKDKETNDTEVEEAAAVGFRRSRHQPSSVAGRMMRLQWHQAHFVRSAVRGTVRHP